MTCTLEKLTANIAKNCEPIVPGVDDLIYIINYADIDKSLCTFNANPLILETIVLETASPSLTAFTLQGQRMSNTKGAIYAPAKYAPAWTHEMMFYIFDNDPVAKKRVGEFANGKFVIIYKNNYINRSKAGTPQDSTWEVIGWDAGLYLTEANNNNADASGGWYLKVATAGDAKESLPPLQFFNTDIATTEAALAALL